MQKFTSSQIPSYVWEKERWTNQKSSSPKDGLIISSNTVNLQENWWRKVSVHVPHTSGKRRTRSCARSMDSTRSRRRWTKFLLLNPVRIELYSWEWWPKFRFLQNAERNAAYFARFKPGYFMYIGPGSEKTLNFEKYPDDPEGKWDELAKQVHAFQRQWFICKNDDGSHQFSERLLCCFGNWWLIALEKLMRSTLTVDEIRLRLFLLQESRRTSLSLNLDLMQNEIVWGCAPIAEGNLVATSPLGDTWHAHSEGSTAEGNLLVTESTNKTASCRKSEQKDRRRTLSTVWTCRLLRNPEDRSRTKHRWMAQHTMRGSWHTNQCWRWTNTSKNLSPEAELGRSEKEIFSTKKRGHWCESAKHKQPWDIGG